MRRREVITLFGAGAAWPLLGGALVARAQSMPAIGILDGGSSSAFASRLASFQKGVVRKKNSPGAPALPDEAIHSLIGRGRYRPPSSVGCDTLDTHMTKG